MLRAPRPEMVAELNEVSSARELVAAKQMATAIVKAGKVTLTSILSQRERRIGLIYETAAEEARSVFLPSLLPEGEGEDEGFIPLSRDSGFKFETSDRNFGEYMIGENYLEADAGK